MKRKTEPGSPEDYSVAALEADLIRFEYWALDAIAKTDHKVKYLNGGPGERPAYLTRHMDAAIAAIQNNPGAPAEAKRAAIILSALPSLWKSLENNGPSWRFAQAVSAFASAIPTPKAAEAIEKLKPKERALKVQPNGVEANKFRAGQFEAGIKEQVTRIVAENPNIKTKKIVALIVQAVEMDSARIAQAQKRGEPLESLDLKFPRKNLKGAPYSERAILDGVREVRRD
jgi:hypothetical protein